MRLALILLAASLASAALYARNRLTVEALPPIPNQERGGCTIHPIRLGPCGVEQGTWSGGKLDGLHDFVFWGMPEGDFVVHQYWMRCSDGVFSFVRVDAREAR